MKLNLNKPMRPTYGVSAEFVRRFNDEFCPLLFIVKYQDGGEGTLEVDEQGKDKHGVVQVVNSPVNPISKKIWLMHWRNGNMGVSEIDPKRGVYYDYAQGEITAITGPHYITFKEGDGL